MRIEAEGAMTGGAPNMIRPMPGDGRPRVVILGAGFGGLAAAMALKGANVDITVIDRRNYHLFQPLLYQVATAGLSPAQIAQPIRAILRRAEAIAAAKRRRLTQVRELVEARTRTVPELTTELFGSAQLTGAQRHFVTAEILAYLAYYEVRRVLRRTRRPDGIFLWSMEQEEAT